MTNVLKGHEDYIVTHTRKEIMQKFNVNYNCVNYFCIKNGLKPIIAEDKELIDLLFSDKDRKEIAGI